MMRFLFMLAVLAIVALASGCGSFGSQRTAKPRKRRPAAVDLRVAERFAARHLGYFDQLSCTTTSMDNITEVPEGHVSCSAYQRNQSEMRGIVFHCKLAGARARGPACRLDEPRQDTGSSLDSPPDSAGGSSPSS